MPDESGLEGLLRELAPQALGALVRRYGHFDLAEDAVQEALLAAATQWPEEGVPEVPRAWLIRVASRRLTDLLRAESARLRREDAVAVRVPADEYLAPAADEGVAGARDDTLLLLFMCCHPALTRASQIALTLRAVGGLTTEEIARAFLVPEATMGQRISRAKQKVKSSGVPFRMPPAGQRDERLAAVLHVLYLVFNEGYAATSGAVLQRAELTREAIRLARMMRRSLPADGEVAGLLALMLLTDARRVARTGPGGDLVPLEEQDRSLWDREAIAEGVTLVAAAMSSGAPPGPYQVQAAIAALHDRAERAEDTDWGQIAGLYGVLERIAPSPLVTVNRAVAVAKVDGPRAGLELLAKVESDSALTEYHRLFAVRAHLLELAGDTAGAIEQYELAAGRTTSVPERDYLRGRAARLR